MAYDNRDPAYVPSQQALAADAYIASTSPETHPDEYTYYPVYGYTYTGPMAHYTSGTEYNTWLNSSLSGSMFGSGQAVADVTNTSPSIPDVDVEALINAFPDAQDTATYTPETFFPNLNPNQAGTVTSIGPAPETTPTTPTTPTTIPTTPTTIPTTPTTPTTTTTPSTTTPSTTTNTNSNNNAGVLTAAGLANALSMLIPQPEPTPPEVIGPSSGGTFNPAPIQRLGFSSPELSPIGSSNQIDYVKEIRASLFRDLI
jgi:hypothetical protein